MAKYDILLVDDSTQNLTVLRKSLESEEYNFLIARSGEEALDIMEKTQPNLILLDIMMPGLNGFETCERIKKSEKNRNVPIIFITAANNKNDIVKGFHVGGADYILKPFLGEEVRARVKNHLESAETLKKLRKANQALEKLAKSDELTGLDNRRKILENINYEKERAMRNKTPFSLIMADIDHFKSINDTHGHETGDRALIHIAKILTDNIRKQDSVSRWGGEEFLILLPETDCKGAEMVAEKIRSKIDSANFKEADKTIDLKISMGVSEYNFDTSIEECIKAADDCLYKAKKAGRNRVVAELIAK